jgi:tripartite ATP-independent transporter DctM subunit
MTWLYSSAILVALLLGAPLFLLIGGAAILAFVMFEHSGFAGLSPVAEQIRGLADQQTLLAIPFFMLSGAIMSAGDISKRLIRWARALVGWMPGGMALSGIGACLLFASITGSSTATLVAIGGLVYPALRKENYGEEFSIGLVTSAGSLGILVPPSIPMLIYCIFNTSTKVEVEKLWLAGIGPAILIAISLGGYSMLMSTKFKAPRYKFSIKELGAATRDGFWALLLPGLILGGIYSGVFTAIEAAAASVVYSVLVEIYFHGGLKWKDIPRVFAETITLVGSFIVIVVMAMSLKEYFTAAGIPERAAAWITGLNLSPFWFLFAVDVLLMVVGCLMDILSALMVFVPLIAPMAAAIGIDPIHLGLIFIVNLEIGYLTPPVGLNLFLAATLFNKTFGQVIKYTFPFVMLMMISLGIVTWVPKVSTVFVEWVYGYKPITPESVQKKKATDAPVTPQPGKVKSLKDLMDEGEGEKPATPDAPEKKGGVKSLKDLMDESEAEPEKPAAAPAAPSTPDAGKQLIH